MRRKEKRGERGGVCVLVHVSCVYYVTPHITQQHTTAHNSRQRIVFLSPLSTLLCVPILSGTAIYPCMHHTTTCRCRSCRRRTLCTSCPLTPCTPLQGHARQHTFCIHCRQDDCPCPKMTGAGAGWCRRNRWTRQVPRRSRGRWCTRSPNSHSSCMRRVDCRFPQRRRRLSRSIP